MNYLLILDLILAATLILGFIRRFVLVAIRKQPNGSGRISQMILLAVITYLGLIFGSLDKLAYLDVLKSGVIAACGFAVLDLALSKYVSYSEHGKSHLSY